MPHLARILAAVGMVAYGIPGEEPPRHFQLFLPDFFESPFEGKDALIELPNRPIQRLSILVLQAQERNISTGTIRVWINGKGMGNVLEATGVEKGTMLVMDPTALRKRPDELFDPKENTIEVLAEDKRGRRYYQNWVLRVSERENVFFAYSGTISPDDPRGVPPDFTFDEPRTPPVIRLGQTHLSVPIKGTLSAAGAGVATSLNGGAFLETTPRATVSFSRTIVVDKSIRELTLEAVDRKGNRRKVMIPVILQSAQPSKVRFAGQRYALVIGISRYGSGPDAPPALFSAAADAADFAAQLETRAGFPKENVRLLVDEKATLEQVRVAFYDFVAKARAEDLLLIHISAHALHDPRPGKSEKLFLACFGTRLSMLDSTAVSFTDLEMLLNRAIRSNQTLLVFDVGHELNAPWKYPGKSMVNNHVLNLFSGQAGRSVLVSGATDEVSQQRETGGRLRGVFSRWLGEAISGGADVNLDRVLTAAEVFRFVTEKVREETGGRQNPRFRLPVASAQTPQDPIALFAVADVR
ncbi:MAG: caspase family protein [Acidobacteria bacterium]|nr:caspase family protein [Acidobacteriota bacterium]